MEFSRLGKRKRAQRLEIIHEITILRVMSDSTEVLVFLSLVDIEACMDDRIAQYEWVFWNHLFYIAPYHSE